MQEIHQSVWIADSAALYGRVAIGEGSSLWPNCVIRAECNEVRIGRHSNLQDFVMVHVGYEHGTRIGDFCSITHHATIHGAEVGDDCLVGVGAVLMDGAVVGRGSIVAPGAVVPPGGVIPPHSVAAGVPARVIRRRDCRAENRLNAWNYCRNALAYAQGEHRAWHGPGYEAFLAEKRAEIARELAREPAAPDAQEGG
ncbi:MAG: gamma carbonic anhydrase family protein [Deltaproteobacteria bacterium]|nr:gamma carbonic anhydrase family protein [Deltaproteobacteria bacterium]MDD9873133.1 gamma carbonic anhydrase family protein [Deltaproteobacteria bacterium]